MEYPRIALNVRPREFNKLVDLGSHVAVNLTSNPNYPAPSPSISVLTTAVADVVGARAAWGPKNNRGSHSDFVNLCNKALNLHLVLKEMALYVANTAGQAAGSDYAALAVLIAGSGFGFAKTKSSRGTLEAVRNFHNFITRSINVNQVKLKWLRPLNTLSGKDISNYRVYRSAMPVFSSAVNIGNTTKGTFIDTNTSGDAVKWYYWVVPFNPYGAGVPSEMVAVTLAGV